MAKGKMVFVGVDRLKQLLVATGLKGKELEKLFGVSHAGFYKWQTKGIIPSDKLGHLLVLNKFGGYEIEANPKIGSESSKILDFKVKDFFNKGEHLFIESKPTDENLEAVRMQINSFTVPVTLLFLSKDEIKMEENTTMRQRLSAIARSSTLGVLPSSSVASASLDELVQEIEKRGWQIKLERKSSSLTNANPKATKKKRNK